MKTKIDKDTLKSSIAVSAIMLLFNLIFSFLGMILIWYWLLPNLCSVLPSLENYFNFLDDAGMERMNNIIYFISSCIAIFPSAVFSYRLSKKRKKEFLKHSKGRISYPDGIKYHIREYGLTDALCMSVIIVIFGSLRLMAGNAGIVKVCPIAFNTFNTFNILGFVLGLLLTLVLAGLSILFGIFFSQRRWRAEYFFEE